MDATSESQPPPKPTKPEFLSCSIETQKREYLPKPKDEVHESKRLRNPQLILDLSLCSKDLNQGFDPKPNLVDQLNVGESENSDKAPQGSDGEPRVFSCNYCQRKFYSSQALGGHQNAHKRERTLAKRGQRMASTAFGSFYPDHLYKSRPLTSSSSSYPSNIAALPLYGSHSSNHSNHRPLGIQAHSLIHKPSYLPFPSTCTSNHGCSRMPMIDQQPAIGRLTMGSISSSSSSSNGRAALFGNIQKNYQPLDRNLGGLFCKGSVNHILKGSSNKQDHDQPHKLDLSLKL